MSKPIFIIRIPSETYSSNLDKYERQLASIKKELREDYHVIMVVESHISNVGFQCFNAVETTDIQIQELSDQIQKRLDNMFNQSDSEPGFDFDI
jgi:hypothetical protein